MTTSNTADVGGMDGDSVQLEEETHEVVEAKNRPRPYPNLS